MRQASDTPYWARYYRVTDKGLIPGIAGALRSRSLHLHDVWMLCRRGAWELELRQFLPPVSLVRSIASLMEMGLIEELDLPDAHA